MLIDVNARIVVDTDQLVYAIVPQNFKQKIYKSCYRLSVLVEQNKFITPIVIASLSVPGVLAIVAGSDYLSDGEYTRIASQWGEALGEFVQTSLFDLAIKSASVSATILIPRALINRGAKEWLRITEPIIDRTIECMFLNAQAIKTPNFMNF